VVWVVRKKARNARGESASKKKEKRGAVSSRVFFSKREFFRGKKGLERIYVLFALKKKSCTRNAKLKVALA
jgi:hypothetical protein